LFFFHLGKYLQHQKFGVLRYCMRLKKSISVIASLVIVGIFASFLVLTKSATLMDWAGALLVIQDEPRTSDIVFVPSGDPAHRLPKAIALLNAGLAQKIVINVERNSESQRIFEKRYGRGFSKKALIDHILNVEKVDSTKVIIPDEHPRSTQDDFRLLNTIITASGVRSIIVTTSWYHLRRCQITARRILGREVAVYFIPASLPNRDTFISAPKRALSLFIAYLKLGYYYLTAW
jgi:uncharacterized SAM-binding protein YcdF (DUF218 family)